MHFENQGMSLWYGTSDATAPSETVQIGSEITVTIGVQPIDASNRVEVLYRTNQGAVESVAAKWLRNDSTRNTQYFRACLPAFRAGDTVEYIAICHCAGRQVPSPEEAKQLASSFRVTGVADKPIADSGANEAVTPESVTATRFPKSGAPIPGTVSPPMTPLAKRTQITSTQKPEKSNSSNVLHQVVGKLVHQQAKTPLAGFTVQAFDVGTGTEVKNLSNPTSNAQGVFVLEYSVPQASSFTGSGKAESRLRLHIVDPQGKEIYQTEIRPQISQTVLEIPVPVPPKADELSFTELAKTTQLQLSQQLQTALAKQNIHTLADIRNAGSIAHVEGLTATADRSVVHTLDAHANLAVFSADAALNAKLIAQGYTSIRAIAEAPQSEFVKAASPTVGDLKAAQLHFQAQAIKSALDNIRADALATAAFRSQEGMAAPLLPLDSAQCSCKDCEAAVSPLAYLVDLLNFATKRLIYGQTRIDLTWLTQFFHQPFGDLVASCDLVKTMVRQVRICIEVLRSATQGQTVAGEKDYLYAAYLTLLSQIGTSYEELRLARTATDEARINLANRLGIDLEPSRPDHLDALLLDPEADQSQPNALTEEALEKLFGLVNTRRNPLSDGAVLADSENIILRWNFDGVEWGKNISPDGLLYGVLALTYLDSPFGDPDTGDIGPGAVVVYIALFSDEQETNLVALGEQSFSQSSSVYPTVSLQEKNSSGLSGQIDIGSAALIGSGHKFQLRVLPLLLCWQLQHLRTLWKNQDHPIPSTKTWPIIDPDLIDERDFRESVSNNSAYTLWQSRNAALDKQDNDWRTQVNGQPNKVDDLIQSVLGVPIGTLDTLVTQRDSGQDIQDQLTALNLDMGSFDRLIKLRKLMQSHSSSLSILSSEWDEFYGILLQVWKRQQFDTWRQEEATQNILLSPDFFVIPSISDPTTPEPVFVIKPWRGTLSARRAWQNTLQGRIDQEQSVWDGLQTAVDATEDATLTKLRDALLLAFEQTQDLELAAKAFTCQFLIDAQVSTCHKTTRISQAIATLQDLIFATRNGDLCFEPLFPLHIDDQYQPIFDEEWRWMGSYSTWRAAMLVFLYPENIAVPTLRRADRQTPVFAALVDQLRTNPRLTPVQACEAANQYSEYLRDVCNLDLQASCIALTPINHGDCYHKVPISSEREILYLFAQSPKGSVYFSSYDRANDFSDFGQSFWDAIPALNSVEQILGAVPYFPNNGNKQILLFVRLQSAGGSKLMFTSYNLFTQQWGSVINLDLPGNGNNFSVAVEQRDDNTSVPPYLVFVMQAWPGAVDTGGTPVFAGKQILFVRDLNTEATGWSLNDFAIFPFLTDLDLKDEIFPRRVMSLLSIAGVFNTIFFEDTNGDFRFLYLISGFYSKNLDTHKIGSHLEWLGGVWISNDIHMYVRDQNDNIKEIDVGPDSGPPLYISENPGPAYLKHLAVHCGTYSNLESWLRVIPAQSQDGPTQFTATFFSGTPYLIVARILAPYSTDVPFDLTEKLSEADLQTRATALSKVFKDNMDSGFARLNPPTNLVYFKEAYFFLPIFLALQLQQAGEYTTALDWFRTVYDYSIPYIPSDVAPTTPTPLIYYGFFLDQSLSTTVQRSSDWLQDPLNPHLLAETRQNCYLRFTLISLVRCLLDFADSEFTRDTVESVEHARLLYQTALRLLNVSVLQPVDSCPSLVIGAPDQYASLTSELNQQAKTINNVKVYQEMTAQVKETLSSNDPWNARLEKIRSIIIESIAKLPPAPTIQQLLEERPQQLVRLDQYLLTQPEIAGAVSQTADLVIHSVAVPKTTGSDSTIQRLQTVITSSKSPALPETTDLKPSAEVSILYPFQQQFVPAITQQFCIPPNPILSALRSRAENNLFKLRHCCNIAGLERQLDPYAAPIDVRTNLPMIASGGRLVLPGTATLHPTPYRYSVLIERAKQLVSIAQQLEAAYLSALEKRDAEAYSLLKARQDMSVAQSSVRLQNLRVTEAQGEVGLAQLQESKAQDQRDHYQSLINEGLNLYEQADLAFLTIATAHEVGAGILDFFTGQYSAGVSSIGSANATIASLNATWASFERRDQEWKFQETIAADEVRIGAQQRSLAEDRLQIVGQERQIAQLQSDHAGAIVDFLANKFTNTELYEWMSNVLGAAYRYFLQQASSIALAAADQLAFERQEAPPPVIQSDYWDVPDSGSSDIGNGSSPDRRGLTGSARLLTDIYQLDQYAFDTNKRKLQLSKTISLAQLAPAEFQRFRETGGMKFATPMEMFDREFPGHYLRLIRRVKTSVIALSPPSQGIRATLSNPGSSKVVVSADYRTVTVRRDPQLVALTSPQNATGLFDLDIQSDLLLPFEGLGVDTSWELLMPKAANQFDYSTIADVLITVEYTALDSFDYRAQLLQSPAFARPISADQPFSFRYQFADQWYDLHNPDQTDTPMVVRFSTRREDFPPNLDELMIQQVVLYFSRANGKLFEIQVDHLYFTEQGSTQPIGGGATSVNGVISTRRGNAPSWIPMIGKSPIGNWELALPNTQEMRDRLKNEENEDIQDILFAITYLGRTPEWPI